MVDVACNVRKIRTSKGLSTYSLAKIMSGNGYSVCQSTISKMENGNRHINSYDIQAIAIALDTSVCDFFKE